MRVSTFAIMLGAASLSLGGCASNRYGYNDNRQLERAAAGAAIGAAAGAAVGAATDLEIEEGAAIGAVAGGVIGAATANDRRWHRDNRGYCYYLDRYDRRVYDYDRRSC
ncbi:YMGG-like glycine zipper-containing protein [Sphingosinicella terrae]|jgi:hypothetical protein|uniref:YMGG-like glycine zipper-containing protein n=1 Tax=Sphingosinicella terrae TaxID=2172047 RepID=UPI000E0CEC64|nr:YMGG-like glycine zipper-containing protein [Sphingosinicella terrae]